MGKGQTLFPLLSFVRRFYLPAGDCQPPLLTLTGREAHHAARVLRLKVGDDLEVLDGRGTVYSCQVRQCRGEELRLEVRQTKEHPAPAWSVTLCAAVTKGKSFEWLLQKATELGATQVVPLLTTRTVPDVAADQRSAKLEKWHWIAVDALKQSGSAWLPLIHPPLPLETALSHTAELDLLGELSPGAPHPRACFEHFKQQHGRPPTRVSAWIGPEGDFTPAEIEALRAAGVQGVTFGARVLRAETAALYALAALQYELSWAQARR